MQKLKSSKRKGWVDLYNNDVYGLSKVIKNFQDKPNPHSNPNPNPNPDPNHNLINYGMLQS
jgi:hypothetical protein